MKKCLNINVQNHQCYAWPYIRWLTNFHCSPHYSFAFFTTQFFWEFLKNLFLVKTKIIETLKHYMFYTLQWPEAVLGWLEWWCGVCVFLHSPKVLHGRHRLSLLDPGCAPCTHYFILEINVKLFTSSTIKFKIQGC